MIPTSPNMQVQTIIRNSFDMTLGPVGKCSVPIYNERCFILGLDLRVLKIPLYANRATRMYLATEFVRICIRMLRIVTLFRLPWRGVRLFVVSGLCACLCDSVAQDFFHCQYTSRRSIRYRQKCPVEVAILIKMLKTISKNNVPAARS